MNGLSTMLAALVPPAPARPVVRNFGTSKTDTLRRILADGPAGSRALSAQTGLSPSLVSALLYADVKRGRIVLRHCLYRLDPNFDARRDRELRAAAALLRAAGYQVIEP